MYGPPGGAFLVAYCDGEPAGGVGLRPWSEAQGTANTHSCEMKRLFVFNEFRGRGIAYLLCTRLITLARRFGYEKMLLDSLAHLQAALHLYEKLGFVDIPPYHYNPDPDTRYMMLAL